MVTGSEDGFRGTRPNDGVWLFGDAPGGGKERAMNAKRSGKCRKINSFGTQVVSPIGGSCWFVPSDELPLISDWGNIFY